MGMKIYGDLDVLGNVNPLQGSDSPGPKPIKDFALANFAIDDPSRVLNQSAGAAIRLEQPDPNGPVQEHVTLDVEPLTEGQPLGVARINVALTNPRYMFDRQLHLTVNVNVAPGSGTQSRAELTTGSDQPPEVVERTYVDTTDLELLTIHVDFFDASRYALTPGRTPLKHYVYVNFNQGGVARQHQLMVQVWSDTPFTGSFALDDQIMWSDTSVGRIVLSPPDPQPIGVIEHKPGANAIEMQLLRHNAEQAYNAFPADIRQSLATYDLRPSHEDYEYIPPPYPSTIERDFEHIPFENHITLAWAEDFDLRDERYALVTKERGVYVVNGMRFPFDPAKLEPTLHLKLIQSETEIDSNSVHKVEVYWPLVSGVPAGYKRWINIHNTIKKGIPDTIEHFTILVNRMASASDLPAYTILWGDGTVFRGGTIGPPGVSPDPTPVWP